MFMDRKNQYSENEYTTQSNLQIQCNPYRDGVLTCLFSQILNSCLLLDTQALIFTNWPLLLLQEAFLVLSIQTAFLLSVTTTTACCLHLFSSLLIAYAFPCPVCTSHLYNQFVRSGTLITDQSLSTEPSPLSALLGSHYHTSISNLSEPKDPFCHQRTLQPLPENCCNFSFCVTSLVAQTVKNLPAMQETWVQSLGQEDPLEKGKATYSCILAQKIPWTEEPGGLQFLGSHKVRHN